MSSLTDRGSGNGARSATSPRLSLEPPVTGRRLRTPELVVGILLVAGWILGTVLLVTGGRDRAPVLALGGDVARGEVITAADLSTAYLGSDSSVAHLEEGEADRGVGGDARAVRGPGRGARVRRRHGGSEPGRRATAVSAVGAGGSSVSRRRRRSRYGDRARSDTRGRRGGIGRGDHGTGVGE